MMITYVLNRLLQAIPVLLIVGLISFAMFAYIGDPLQIMLGQEYDPAQRAELVQRMGLDQPFYVQYVRYLRRMAAADFGISYRMGLPVTELLARSFPATFELVLTSMTLSVAAGIGLGVYTALHPRSALTSAAMASSLVGVSLPTFVVAMALILVFSVSLGWLPSFGRGDVVDLGVWSTGFLTWGGLKALVLPSLTIAVYQTTLIMRLVRTEMLAVLRSDHIRFARARGIRRHVLHFRYALRNTLTPVITVVGLQFGGVLSFAMVTESVMQWPGMGNLLVQSIRAVDIPVMAAYLMLIAVVFVLINLVVDLLYVVFDPRLRRQMRGAR